MTSSTSRAVATPAIVEGIGARVSAGRPRRMPRAWGKRGRREGMEMAEREEEEEGFWLGFWGRGGNCREKRGKAIEIEGQGVWGWGRVVSLLEHLLQTTNNTSPKYLYTVTSYYRY